MEALLYIVGIPLLCGIIVYFLTKPYYDQKKKEEIESQRWRAERQRQERKQKEAEWQNFLSEREKAFGKLTKEISIAFVRKNNIFIYGDAKVLFIHDKQYNFADILSCRNEQRTIRGKEVSRVTTPDKGEMALEKLLWGMDKSYNVKTETKITRTPDKMENTIYIGVNSLENPQIVIRLGDSTTKANEICAVMNVIINNTNKNE